MLCCLAITVGSHAEVHSLAQGLHIPARFVGDGFPMRARFIYLSVITTLLAILAWGHSTHWSLPIHPSVAVKPAKRATVAAPNVAPGDDKQPAKTELHLDDEAIRKAGIEVEDVRSRRIEQKIDAHGVVAYNQDAVAQLSSRVKGNVWRVEKRVGENVHRGEVLAIVESLAVGEAKTDLLRAIVTADLKQSNLKRLRDASAAVPERVIREAEADAREANVRLLSARQTLISLGLKIDLADLKNIDDEALAQRIQFLGLPDSIRDTLDPLSTTGNLIPVVAPFDGVVIGRATSIGELVSPEDSQFVVADTSRMWLLLDIRKEDVGYVRIGQRLSFEADGVSGTVQGIIDWISTEMDEKTRTLTVRAVVNNPLVDAQRGGQEQRLLRTHTFGTGHIVVRERPEAIAVPNEAVQFDGQRHYVFVREGEIFRRRDVRTGVVKDGWTEILSGLAAREQVATVGAHVLKAELLIVSAQ